MKKEFKQAGENINGECHSFPCFILQFVGRFLQLCRVSNMCDQNVLENSLFR